MLLWSDLWLVLCDAITRWPLRAGLGESQGRILILSLAKGTLLPVFNLLLWMLCCDEGSAVSVLFETWLRILSKNLFHNHYLATCLPHQQWYCFVWTLNSFPPTLCFWFQVALHFWQNLCWCCRVYSCSFLVVQLLAWTGTEDLFRDCF